MAGFELLHATSTGGGFAPGAAFARARPALPALEADPAAAPSRARPALQLPAPELAEAEAGGSAIYQAKSVRLAMDSSGNTGLDLRWDEEWGIWVESVDPLPGQPGLSAGDFIVAIDGCSLRHREHDECDTLFSERLEDGVVLSVVTPAKSGSSNSLGLGVGGGRVQELEFSGEHLVGKASGRGRGAHSNMQMPIRGQPMPEAWRDWRRPVGRGRRGGYDASKMWNRFRGPPW